jgi:hypothetical protein
LPNCWRPIFLVLPKLYGCQVGLSNCWSCFKSFVLQPTLLFLLAQTLQALFVSVATGRALRKIAMAAFCGCGVQQTRVHYAAFNRIIRIGPPRTRDERKQIGP